MAGRPTQEIVRVEVHGLDELERDFPLWANRTEQSVRGMTLQIAKLTAQVTALRVPRLSGALAGSVRAAQVEAAVPTARVYEGERLAYGRWIEYGRRRRGTRGPKTGRYLEPTAKREKRQFKKRLADTTQREIERYPWPNPKA